MGFNSAFKGLNHGLSKRGDPFARSTKITNSKIFPACGYDFCKKRFLCFQAKSMETILILYPRELTRTESAVLRD